MAVVTAAAIGGVAAVGSAVIGSKASRRAGDQQADAAREGNALLERQYNQSREDLAPFREGGNRAFDAMMGELGLGGPDSPYGQFGGSGDEGYGGFKETPGYRFAFDEGQRSLDAAASSAGMLESGRHMKDAMRYGTGMAEQEYGNYFNRLSGAANTGLNAAAATTNAGMAYAGQAANGLQRAGDAQAQGTIGRANAIAGGIGGVVGAAGTYFGGRATNRGAPQVGAPSGGWTYTENDIDWGIFG